MVNNQEIERKRDFEEAKVTVILEVLDPLALSLLEAKNLKSKLGAFDVLDHEKSWELWKGETYFLVDIRTDSERSTENPYLETLNLTFENGFIGVDLVTEVFEITFEEFSDYCNLNLDLAKDCWASVVETIHEIESLDN